MTAKRKLLICGVALAAALVIICLGIWLQWPEGVCTFIAALVAVVILMPLLDSKKQK
jgi:hypothetical protein